MRQPLSDFQFLIVYLSKICTFAVYKHIVEMRIRRLILAACFIMATVCSPMAADTIPSGFSRRPQWHLGAEISPAYVPATNIFLRGYNVLDKRIDRSISGSVRAGFCFNDSTQEGILYKGLYQGVGIGAVSFFNHSLLGTPVSAYVYQGAPVVRFSRRLWLGYEWKFGAAFGWHHDTESAQLNAAVSTSVTAMMALGLKLHYSLSDRCALTLGAEATHFSNGNTSWPNAGVNSVGASIGFTYMIDPQPQGHVSSPELEHEADRGRWMYDIVVFGAWRKRVVNIGEQSEPQLCPGRFGVIGVQFSPLRSLNRWVAVGPALDLQWDESAGLDTYWVDGSYGDNIKFHRPPFVKQISAGISAHAELTMPIFSVNAGLGYDILNPKGNKRFYQSLTLKTFVTRSLYINVGYRLGNFKDPQNLMVGIGLRL